MSKIRYLSNILYNYKNSFDFKNIEIFFEYNNIDYIINLFFEIELLYNSLYVFFKKKLYILQNYSLKNLILKRVCKSINNANILILFVLKRSESLCLCINYRNLNIITIKN